MSRIQIRQKVKTAVLGMALVLGVLANAERGATAKIRGVPEPANHQHMAGGPVVPEAVRIRMEADIHPVVLRAIGVRVVRPCGDETRAT